MSISTETPDPAAVFAASLSLWTKCQQLDEVNLSSCFNGLDQLMRIVMEVSERFERWACSHVAFDELEEVWPYFLQEWFGEACLAILPPQGLAKFDDMDCLRTALQLRLPITVSDNLPVPVELRLANPMEGPGFKEYRIRTIRYSREDLELEPMTRNDDPFDESFDAPCFALFGVSGEDTEEHIANRDTFSEMTRLMSRLLPAIELPARLVSSAPPPEPVQTIP